MLGVDAPTGLEAWAAGISTLALVVLSGIGMKLIAARKRALESSVHARWVSALVITIAALACIYFGGFAFVLWVGAASWIAADELLLLLAGTRLPLFAVLTHCANLSIVLSAWAQRFIHPVRHLPITDNLTDAVTIMWIVAFLLVPVFAGRFRSLPVNEAKAVLAVICTGWFLAHLILLRNLPDGFGATMFLVLSVAANDAFAYITGNLFGRTKLSALVSPKKTIEGLAGGTIATFLVGAAAPWLMPGAGLPAVLALSCAVAILAPCGDMAMSAVKREAGVKDSSALIPGHGGILDRAGSFVLIAPIYFYLFTALIAR